jgi:hypothetical protein
VFGNQTRSLTYRMLDRTSVDTTLATNLLLQLKPQTFSQETPFDPQNMDHTSFLTESLVAIDNRVASDADLSEQAT